MATMTATTRTVRPHGATRATRMSLPRVGVLLVAVLFLLHGLAHAAGLAGIFGLGDAPAENISTLAAGLAPDDLTFRLLGAAWVVALVLFVAASAGIVLRRRWWLPLAVAATTVSLALCLVWARAAVVGLVLNWDILLGLAVWMYLGRRRTCARGIEVQPEAQPAVA